MWIFRGKIQLKNCISSTELCFYKGDEINLSADISLKNGMYIFCTKG